MRLQVLFTFLMRLRTSALLFLMTLPLIMAVKCIPYEAPPEAPVSEETSPGNPDNGGGTPGGGPGTDASTPAPPTCTADDAAACGDRVCGDVANNCGETVSCGPCESPSVCTVGGQCECTATEGWCGDRTCGQVTDSCGEMQTCGECAAGDECSAEGQCPCIAPADETPCAGLTCGTVLDSCGNTRNCGSGCADGEACEDNVCACPTAVDLCGVCDGDDSTCQDVCDVPNGDGTSCLDECGVPKGDNSTCTDDCGVVNGDNSDCADDCGVPNGSNNTCGAAATAATPCADPWAAEITVRDANFTKIICGCEETRGKLCTVPAGTEVTWVWDGVTEDAHNVKPDGSGDFGSEDIDSGSYSYRFDTPGTYAYRCTVHSPMKATLEVK